jgi:Tfp pilus assembly protein PilX
VIGTRSPRRGGFALATLLMIIFLLLVFGLTLADLTTSAYQLSYQAGEQNRAVEVAQAGVHQMIDRLTTNPNNSSGISTTLDGGNITVTVIDNLQGITAASGVPPYCAQIDSVGATASGRSAHLQVLVQFQSFPYAVAGYAGVQAQALTVAGASDITSFLSSNQTGLQGHVYSGGASPTSLTAAAGTSISGRARSVGGVVIGSPSTVAQGIDQDVTPEILPSLDITSFDNQATPGVTVQNSGGPYLALPVTGPTYVDGDITLVSPVFVNGQLYVNGNLDIQVALTGIGSIFCTGTCHIYGAGALVATDGIAVFSQGDMSVQGPFFQGVLFSQGNLNIGSGVTVLGAAISTQQVTCAGPIQVVYLSQYTQFGSSFSQHSMLGSLVNGPTPLLKVLFWKDVS